MQPAIKKKNTIEAFEMDGMRDGFAEAKVTRSKTSYNMDRRVRLLPMSATIRGITDRLWADQWWEVIEKAGIQIETGKPLLPGRTQDGWHTLPLSAEAATNWLRTSTKRGCRGLERIRPSPHVFLGCQSGTQTHRCVA